MASAIDWTRGRDRPVLAHDAADFVLDGPLLVGGQRPIQRVVEAEVVRRNERTGLVRLRADDVAQGSVEQMRGGVIAHRAGPPLGVDTGGDRLADLEPAVELAAMHEQAGDRLLRVFDLEERRCRRPGSEQLAMVADLPAALAVERRRVQHDVGRSVAGQLLVFGPVAQDRHDLRVGFGAVVAQELRLADAPLDAW
jgi:hypothetical protein